MVDTPANTTRACEGPVVSFARWVCRPHNSVSIRRIPCVIGRTTRRHSLTQLDALKAPMIAEATAQARRAAEQFARDSRSSLGGIRTATQGYFEILPRDQAPGISQESQVVKTVRVVTTVVYGLGG